MNKVKTLLNNIKKNMITIKKNFKENLLKEIIQLKKENIELSKAKDNYELESNKIKDEFIIFKKENNVDELNRKIEYCEHMASRFKEQRDSLREDIKKLNDKYNELYNQNQQNESLIRLLDNNNTNENNEEL